MSQPVPVNIPGLTPPGALKKQAASAETKEDVREKMQQLVTQARPTPQPQPTPAEQPQPQLRAKIMIGTPAYGGQCYVSYVLSFLNSLKFCSQHRIYLEPCFLTNESLIPRGRNTVVAKFLARKDLTHLLFIDADVSWAPGTIVRLLNHDQDIVGAFYPKKGYEWQKLLQNKEVLAMLNKADQDNRSLTEEEIKQIRAKLMSFVVNLEQGKTGIQGAGLLQVKHLGTGFMMIKRHVLEKMADALPELKYDDDINILSPEENKHLYAFFNTEVHKLSVKRHFLSEDYLFCKRWTDMGGKIFGDINIPLTHTGTHSFAGHFAVSHNFRPQAPENVAAAASAPQEVETVEQRQQLEEATKSDEEPKMTVTRQPAPAPAPAPEPIQNISQAGSVAPSARLNPSQLKNLQIK